MDLQIYETIESSFNYFLDFLQHYIVKMKVAVLQHLLVARIFANGLITYQYLLDTIYFLLILDIHLNF